MGEPIVEHGVLELIAVIAANLLDGSSIELFN